MTCWWPAGPHATHPPHSAPRAGSRRTAQTGASSLQTATASQSCRDRHHPSCRRRRRRTRPRPHTPGGPPQWRPTRRAHPGCPQPPPGRKGLPLQPCRSGRSPPSPLQITTGTGSRVSNVAVGSELGRAGRAEKALRGLESRGAGAVLRRELPRSAGTRIRAVPRHPQARYGFRQVTRPGGGVPGAGVCGCGAAGQKVWRLSLGEAPDIRPTPRPSLHARRRGRLQGGGPGAHRWERAVTRLRAASTGRRRRAGVNAALPAGGATARRRTASAKPRHARGLPANSRNGGREARTLWGA